MCVSSPPPRRAGSTADSEAAQVPGAGSNRSGARTGGAQGAREAGGKFGLAQVSRCRHQQPQVCVCVCVCVWVCVYV